ncbi:MAG: hypothetical protein NTX08_02520 [Sphingobacteriales bacterium]|nr:hypothetical protein [Sphingobacteriales bacterium]
MKLKLYIFLLLQLAFNISFSQRTIREYWDYKKTKIQEEVQVNAMGNNHGFYRSYYRIGGYRETGFYTNGIKTGLWSEYREGSTKPWYQSSMIYSNGHQYTTMTKEWFEQGSDAGKLKEWKEWDISEYRDRNNPQDVDYESEFLKVKHIRYINQDQRDYNPIKYMIWFDLDIRKTLPIEKRGYKKYNENGTLIEQWLFTKTGDKIRTSYDGDGLLLDKHIINTNGVIVAWEVAVWTEENKEYLRNFYYEKLFGRGYEFSDYSQNTIKAYDNYTSNFINCLIEKITNNNKSFNMGNIGLQNPSVAEMIDSCNEEFYPEKILHGINRIESYKLYNSCWQTVDTKGLGAYDDDNGIDSCITQSKNSLLVNNNLIYCKLNLGLSYFLKNDSATAFTYYREAIKDITKLKCKYAKIYWLQSAIDDIWRSVDNKRHKMENDVYYYSTMLPKYRLVVDIFGKEILKYQ